MKITEDIRRYAAEQGLAEGEAVDAGMQRMADEFRKKGSELYVEAGD
jgi:phosphomethylpyrimidine synthase